MSPDSVVDSWQPHMLIVELVAAEFDSTDAGKPLPPKQQPGFAVAKQLHS